MPGLNQIPIFAAFILANSQALGAMDIVNRGAWGAKPALVGMLPHLPNELTIHHTGERQQPRIRLEAKMLGLQQFSQTAAQVTRTHRKPVWPDVPYHYYIDVGGRTAEGRDVRFQGDTNTGYSVRGKILIVLEGQFDVEQPTLPQMRALYELIGELLGRHAIQRIAAHNDYSATDCPGKALKAELPALRERFHLSGWIN